MKNLLIYIGPEKKFSPEHEVLTKMQIDNSLSLGWEVEDILLVTDFDWKYRGVNTHVVKGDFSALDGNRSSKILVISRLFDEGMIRDGDLVWFHDHDAFQLEPFAAPRLGDAVAAFTTHGWSKKWNAGSFFFNRGAADMFMLIYGCMLEEKCNEQDALTHLWERGLSSYLILNITYNINIYHMGYNLRKATQPILVAHFHPRKPKHLNLFRSLIPERLMKIFNEYGLK